VTRYRIELRPAAVRALRKLDPQVRHRLQGAIALLAETHVRRPRARCADDLAFGFASGTTASSTRSPTTCSWSFVVTLGHRRDVYQR